MKKLTMLIACGFLFGISSQIIAQNVQQSIDQQIIQLLENNQITSQDANWVITDQHVSSASGIEHVYFRQIHNGIEIYGTESSVHLYPNGEVLKGNNKFISNVNEKATGGSSPSLTALQAVQNAAGYFNYTVSSEISVISSNISSHETILSDGGISMSNIPAKLVYQMNQNDELVLAWDLSIEEVAQQDWWSVRVDATNGSIVDQNNFMSSCNFDHDHSAHEVLDYNENLYDIPNYKEAMAKR
ncbi:MAG: hypothetical protein JKY22_10125, partial [Flavobacteriaceae bacterium]|nr:hypothetical protein [Flavobacteriaceae bacterium]